MQFLDRADTFSDRLAGLSPADWAKPSPCQGWNASDVLDHIIDTQRSLFAERDINLGTRPGGDPTQAWAAHLRSVRSAVEDEQAMLASYEGWFGPTTLADTLLAFYGFDLIVHAWDILAAAGRQLVWTPDELGILEDAITGWGEALYMDGICRPALEVEPEADHQTRLLALLGRRAGPTL